MAEVEPKGLWYIQPSFLFGVICVINLMNYVDRGIIPGATNEFNTFIDEDLNTDTPDVYLGLLQSSFIIGFMMGSILFSHLIHTHGRFFLVAVGCTVWVVAVVLCGISYYTGSYVFLLFCRILSGVGEASIQTAIPPWIQTEAPASSRGTWLALFYTAIPVGTALGYAYSSIVASAAGWQWVFFIEAMVMIPLIVFLYFIAPHFPCDSHQRKHTSEGGQPSMMTELRAVCTSSIFLCISMAYAAQAATLQGLSTFGSAFLMGLGYFDTESAASSVFGVVVSVTGMISTPLGGMLLDRWLKKAEDEADSQQPQPRQSFRESIEAAEHQLEAFVLNSEEQTASVHVQADAALATASHSKGGPAAAQFKAQLDKICILTAGFSALAAIAMCFTFFTRSAAPFLLLTALGAGMLFCTYSAINMGVMLSVPVEHRSFGIAINTFLLHAVGDVPAPILVGYIKDSLAPGCIADSGSDDDEVASSPECRDDAAGLRDTMLLTDLWLWWTVLFFVVGWYLNRKQILVIPWCAAESSAEEIRSPLLSGEEEDSAAKKFAANEPTSVVVSDLHDNRND